MSRYGLYGVEINGTLVGGITRCGILPRSQVRAEAMSGEAYARFSSMIAQHPIIPMATRHIGPILDITGALGYVLAGTASIAEIYLQKYAHGSTRASGSVHRKFTITQGLVLPRRLSASHQGDAELTFDILSIYDGTNDPVIITETQALPAGLADAYRYAFYKAAIGGVTLDEDMSLEIDFGLQDRAEGKRSEIWPRMISIAQVMPTISITCKNPDAFAAANIPLAGKAATHANTTIYLRKRSAGGSFVADATAEHISLTAAGMVHAESVFDAAGNETGETRFVMAATFDGTNAPIVIDTTAAVA